MKNKRKKILYREGWLRINSENGRYALWGENLFTGYPILLNPGFHCGDTMQVKLANGKWKSTRIEMRQDGSWYLCDVNCPKSLNNIKVRVIMKYIIT